MRKKRFILSTFVAIINQVITLICGLILPKVILENFGSEINGLVSSVSQFLAVVTLLDMGVGAVVQSALYLPISKKDNTLISKIIKASKLYFNKIGIVLVIYTIGLMIIYPFFVHSSLDYLSTMGLILAISISLISQYFFGVSNQLLLNADQKAYIPLILQSICTLLNTILSVVAIKMGGSIVTVKFVSSFVLLLRPLALAIIVKKSYSIDSGVNLEADPLPQKWNALGQHIATFIVDKTDIVVLTIFSTLQNVSIYYVYHLVVQGVYQAFFVLLTGVQSLLGDMYAKKEMEKFKSTFSLFEWGIHNLVIILYSCSWILIIPFVKVYTLKISDANYIQPIFAILMILAYTFCSLRNFYNLIIKAVGQYKETQLSAIIEAIINIVVSIALVWKFGLIGVAIGTLIAMFYRTIYFIVYIKRHIVKIESKVILKQFFVDTIIFGACIFVGGFIPLFGLTYLYWFLMAIIVFLMVVIISFILNSIFYMKYIRLIINSLHKKLFYKKRRKTLTDHLL